MEIYNDIKIVDLSLYLEKFNTLIISDLQIGFEEDLNRKGIFVPRRQNELMLNRLRKILSLVNPRRVIINGDFKHIFHGINRQEWNGVNSFIDLIYEFCNEIILIKGNHDVNLGIIAKKRNITVRESYQIEDVYITHGHNLYLDPMNSKIVIIGHEHPAITLREGSKVEKYKCFLRGTFSDKVLIVMPSFNPLSEGSDILSEKTLSPFLHDGLNDFEVYVVEDKVYKFGKLQSLR